MTYGVGRWADDIASSCLSQITKLFCSSSPCPRQVVRLMSFSFCYFMALLAYNILLPQRMVIKQIWCEFIVAVAIRYRGCARVYVCGGALSRSLCSRGVWCVLLPHLRVDTSDDACLWNMLMECINGDTIIRIILLHCNGGWWCVPRMPNEGATIDCPGIIKSISSGARRRISGSGGCPPHPVARLEVH